MLDVSEYNDVLILHPCHPRSTLSESHVLVGVTENSGRVYGVPKKYEYAIFETTEVNSGLFAGWEVISSHLVVNPDDNLIIGNHLGAFVCRREIVD